MKRVLTLLLGTVFASQAYASEGALQIVPEHKFSGNVELGGYQTTGNTVSESMDGVLELNYTFGDWSSEFLFKGSQTSEDGVLTSDYYESSIKGKYEMPYHTYFFLGVGYRQDYFSGIYSEVTELAGLGYHFFADEENIKVDFEIGYGNRITKKLVNGVLRSRVDYDPGTHTALMAEYQFTEQDLIEASVTVESGNDDAFIRKEFSWKHALVDEFSLKYTYEVRELTTPEVGKLGTDSKATLTLVYGF